MLFSQLAAITSGDILRLSKDQRIISFLTDSRKVSAVDGALFFAITGKHHNGHEYIGDLYGKGIRQFIIEDDAGFKTADYADANVLKVGSSLRALQSIAAEHRSYLKIPVIGITGSNGKTIIKEWLFQLLSSDYKIAKNPGSYNSQLGVPLSVWQLQNHHDLGIFEAGISKPGEMEHLAEIIQPTIGIFTNAGSAHDEGFTSRAEKINEKLKLFSKTKILIYCTDHADVNKAIEDLNLTTLSWGTSNAASIQIKSQGESYAISFKGISFSLTLPFSDKASIENCFHCVAVMLHLGYKGDVIQDRVQMLQAVPMRLELKEGINQSQIIDDTYNNDLAGLQISLEFLSNQNQKPKKRVILSDILESGISGEQLSKKVSSIIAENNIQSFVGIGKTLAEHSKLFPPSAQFFATTTDFLKNFDFNSIQHEVVLVKGARVFQFEKIIERLQRKVHGTVMEIDLGAVVHNLNFFRARLDPSTKIMAMVKAFAYGSGSNEIANLLQFHKVNYLGVAYADEGIDLRANNISLPIMVMNPTEESFSSLLQYNLEPEIYSFKILESYLNFLRGRAGTIHLKLDTGMHRLGFDEQDLESLIAILLKNPSLKIASVFSHMAGADEAVHDSFSKEQAAKFQRNAGKISQAIGYKPLYHILNSPGILRLPQYQFDMVRLGIGLYGIDPTNDGVAGMKSVAKLKTIISQIKKINAGESIGYGRQGKAQKPLTIATIAIGYADGFSRAFSRGVGTVLVNEKPAPVIGNVCMDMTMIDISGIEAKEGDEVIIFGDALPIQKVADSINTIPYEILTNTNERVKRVFVAESM
jgi:Alr-MurF fusion protein